MMLAVEVPHAISGTVHTTFGVPGDHCSEHSLLPLQPANHPICLRPNPFESPYTLSYYTGATSTDQHGTRAYSFKARYRLDQGAADSINTRRRLDQYAVQVRSRRSRPYHLAWVLSIY